MVWKYSTESQKWRLILMIIFIILLLIGAQSEEAKATENVVIQVHPMSSATVQYGYNEAPLNVRAEQNVESKWISQYPARATIKILEDCGEWLLVEGGFVKEEYVFESVEIYQVGLLLENSPIYAEPKYFSEILGSVYKDDNEVFVKKVNGFLELSTGGYISENVVTFDFEEEVEIFANTLSIEDMETWNMINLPIQYLGTLTTKTAGDGVTAKSRLFFKGDIPIYDIINGYAYFPSGRNIFKISVESFSGIKNVGIEYDTVAAYRTIYYSSSKSRKHNIALVSSYLDGTIIPSGKTFSYNKTTGPRSEAMGYEQANVIMNGEYVSDFGGGVCQVSSTIYAAIMQLPDFRVTARKPHGLEVTYLPLGMDATVSYGGVDLKFVNNLPFGVKLNVKTNDDGICLVTFTRVE